MSNSPDELQINEPASGPVSSPVDSPQTTRAPIDALQEMRVVTVALFVAVLVISAAFNVYVYKQNARVQLELENATNQIKQIEQNQQVQQNRAAMQNLINELMAQIPTHPEAQQILARYNIPTQPAPPAQPAPPGK